MSGKKKRGLSADEKRQVILEIYHSQKEPFNLKEIESLASKRGVVLQTIKEQNQSLVDDSLVLSDKIGSANFFWSFPSQAIHEQNMKKRNLEEMIASTSQNCINEQQKIDQLKLERADPGRPEKLQRLSELNEELIRLNRELEERSSTDPEETQRILQSADLNKRAADRWTENIWNIKKFLTKKKGMGSKEVDKLLGIDDSFDYPVYAPPKKRK